ncbi:MAG: DUF2800 domain-containing protein [Bacteroidetes bacterium]|nr:DUF2800 domain-containing protein [Bacteroidota bacterium]
MPGTHSLLSPSSASRWLRCTPSARLEESFTDKAGEAAAEGTLAHSLGELLIKNQLKLISKAVFNKEFKAIKENKFYDAAMQEHAENYAAYVLERFSEAKSHTPDAVLYLEQRLDMTRYVPEGFGTGDAVIIANGVLDINDLKYGKGVTVFAENNPQMKLYALGALDEFDFMYEIHTVRMTIFQPRIDNISTWELPVSELRAWAEEELKPRAALAFDGGGDYTPGAHCQFCRAKATCKANADFNLEIAKHEFKAERLMSDDEIADVLNRAPLFTAWLSAVLEHALDQAVNHGKRWPGFKLVEGKSNRVYTDEEKVAEFLIKEHKYSEDIIYQPRKILGITAMEKALGKGVFASTLNGYIIKPPGKPTLVPISDKREEINSNESAIADFS